MNFTYLIPHAGSEDLLRVCKDAINRNTKGDVLVSFLTQHWSDAFLWLFDNCPTGIGVFIDDDCILLDDISEYIKHVEENYILAVDGGALGRGKGYYQSNLMILNIARFKEEFGREGVFVDRELAHREIGKKHSEFMYGISQRLKGKVKKEFIAKNGKYPLSSIFCFEDKPIAYHLWYGAWKHRGLRHEAGVDLAVREKQFIEDYENRGLYDSL